MKKILILGLLLISVLLALAAENPEDVTNQVGLELKDTDSVVFEVYPADIDSAEDSKPIDKINVARSSGDTFYVSVYFRVKVTSTHTLHLTLSTDGPLSLEGSDDSTQKVDYSLYHYGTYFESDDTRTPIEEDKNVNFVLELADAPYVFGKSPFGSADYDYSDKNFYHIGFSGYLNINDATMSYFTVTIEKKNIEGKKFGTYSSNIYLTATTAD